MFSNTKLFSNFISLSVVQGINFLIPLLVMPYVISKTGADGFGVIAVAQVLMIYLATISDYGFNLSASRDIALVKNDRHKLSTIFVTVLASKILISFMLFLILIILSILLPVIRDNFVLYVWGFTYVIGQSIFVNWLFQGIEKMYYITVCSLLSRLVFVALIIGFIHEKGDGKYFLFFLGIGNLVAGLLSIYIGFAVLKLKLLPPRREAVLNELRNGWQITLSNISINTFLYSGIFILRIFTNDLIVGYYSIAERIFFAARQVLAVFSQAIYPHLCRLTRAGKSQSVLFFKQVYFPFLLLTMAGSSMLFLFAGHIVRFFISEDAALPVLLLRVLSFVPVIVCLNIPAYQLLLAFDRRKSYLRIYSIATLINITVNILLVNFWGALGTAVTIIITELFITISLNRDLFKNKLEGYLFYDKNLHSSRENGHDIN